MKTMITSIGEDSNEVAIEAKKFYVTTLTQQYSFYLSGQILSPDHYTDWFQAMRLASSTDIIKIHINSQGGEAPTAIQFRRVISEVEAPVIISVEGDCMSAATMILMAADKIEISPHSSFMFHNYSGVSVGKGGEMYDSISHERKWSENLLKDIYKDFLTEAEIHAILENKDLWMETDEVLKRLEKKIKIDLKKVRK